MTARDLDHQTEQLPDRYEIVAVGIATLVMAAWVVALLEGYQSTMLNVVMAVAAVVGSGIIVRHEWRQVRS